MSQTYLHYDLPEFGDFLYETPASRTDKSSSKLQGSPAWQPISGISQNALVPSTTAGENLVHFSGCPVPRQKELPPFVFVKQKTMQMFIPGIIGGPPLLKSECLFHLNIPSSTYIFKQADFWLMFHTSLVSKFIGLYLFNLVQKAVVIAQHQYT